MTRIKNGHGFICGPDKIVDLTKFGAKVWVIYYNYMRPTFYRSKSIIKPIQYPSRKTWEAFDKWYIINKEK